MKLRPTGKRFVDRDSFAGAGKWARRLGVQCAEGERFKIIVADQLFQRPIGLAKNATGGVSSSFQPRITEALHRFVRQHILLLRQPPCGRVLCSA